MHEVYAMLHENIAHIPNVLFVGNFYIQMMHGEGTGAALCLGSARATPGPNRRAQSCGRAGGSRPALPRAGRDTCSVSGLLQKLRAVQITEFGQ